MTELSQFHFLRPWWLLLMFPAAALVWSILCRQDPLRRWKQLIAPELLRHLLIRDRSGRNGLRPAYLLAGAWLVATLALAGPSWQREATPFAEDQAALVIALKVTPEMLAQDVQPSRLERAVHKIHDLLDLRPATRTALIAYAGSAHQVMPLTTDPEIIESFASELLPDLMPVAGDAAARAVRMANGILERAGVAGSVLLMADSVDPLEYEDLRASREDDGVDVHILALAAGPDVVPPAGSPPAAALDADAMAEAAKAAGGSLVVVTADDSDVRQLNARIDRSIARLPTRESERWEDAGYYLLPFLALLLLPFARRGAAVELQA